MRDAYLDSAAQGATALDDIAADESALSGSPNTPFRVTKTVSAQP